MQVYKSCYTTEENTPTPPQFGAHAYALRFSPEDLLAHKKKPPQLPLHGGPKAFAPDDSNEQDDTLKSLLQEQRDILQEQRVSKKY